MLRAVRVLSGIGGGNTVRRPKQPAGGAVVSLLSGARAFSSTHVSKGDRVDLTHIPPSAFNPQGSDPERAKLTFTNPSNRIKETQNGSILPHPANPECKLFTSTEGEKVSNIYYPQYHEIQHILPNQSPAYL